MKKIKSVNNQIFEQILSVNNQKEDEFNNGQDGATILSLLMMFFIPFILLNAGRNFFSIDYSFSAVVGMLAVSTLTTVILYKKFKISSRFAEKGIVLNQLLSRYTPNDKNEYQKLQEERQVGSQNFFTLVKDWADVEQQYYSKQR